VPLSIVLGYLSAMSRNKTVDRIISIMSITTLSVPDFVIAFILISILAVTLPVFPSIALLMKSTSIWQMLYTISLPVLTLCLVMMPNIIRLTRATIINLLSRPFIEMAILKGLRKHRIFIYHALPHAVGPIINVVILGIANLIIGIVIVEVVFAYPGIGQLMIDAVRMRDVPIVQVCGLIFTVIYIILTLIADLVAIISNPRLAANMLTVEKPKVVKKMKKIWIKRLAVISASSIIVVIGFVYIRDYLRGFQHHRTDTEFVSSAQVTAHKERLTATDLFTDHYQGAGPVHNALFMPADNASPPLHKFAGTLIIEATKISGRSLEATGRRSFGSFPALKVNFFTLQDHLVPVERNRLLESEESSWNIILAPGRIWSESGDKGYSRASFPFTLVNSNWGWSHTHNGIATFLFDHKRVSRLRFQIVQESAPGAKFDAWGQAQMTYLPSPLPNQAALVKRFEKELARQIPIHPWRELEQTYDPKSLDRIDDTSNRKNITLSGLIIEDVIYARACRTRYGDYPYCDQMRHSVASVSKSLGALVAMLRLAQKYGDEVFDLRITDYVNIDANHDGWKNVTFADALNMATGIGDKVPQRVSNYVDVDFTPLANKIARARSTNEKLKAIASFGNYPWEPGEVFRYRSSDTFVLAVAMDRFLRSKEGHRADLWKMMSKEVFEPIGIFNLPFLHTAEPRGESSIPLLSYGMIPSLDDVAKLVKLMRHGGRHQGKQILSATKLAEALGPSMKIGLPTGWPLEHGEVTYHMSFWQHPYRAQSGRLIRIPAMSGIGGNYVIIMPNGITALRFADGRYNNPGTWDSSGLRKVADYIRPF
jgi:CubicO group peptidase (beta-lactamase class C family)